MEICKICKGDFEKSPDKLILCRHYKGFVHKGCCIHKCSKDGRPCEHAIAEYDRMSLALNE